MPTSSEFDIRGDERQNVERGSIEWSPATGARINQTRTDCGIAGCPHIPTCASPEQETGCVAEARAAGRYDMSTSTPPTPSPADCTSGVAPTVG